MADNEERALEEQLELQLNDQKDSLIAVDDALACDSSNAELLAVHAELVQSIQDAEEGLLHLKRARLLQECDSVLLGSRNSVEVEDLESVEGADVEAEPLADVEAEPLADVDAEPLADQSYVVGSKCRFRYSDGRWYNGFIFGFEGRLAKVSFLTPTTDSMLMCKFFLQQRCRFGSNCRLSHGADVPMTSLKMYLPTLWDQSLVGSSIWAASTNTKTWIWREAELESWDERKQLAHVVFRDDGSSVELGADSISLSKYAQSSDEDESNTSSDEYDSGSDEEEGSSPQGLGFLEASMHSGIQTETTFFAKWENHTRGIASKMMANMGYREGMGLGASGQGILDPISVKVLPPKQSLGHAVEIRETNDNYEAIRKKKRSRGGKRKREKKFAEAARAAKREEEDAERDVFSLINSQLAKHSETPNSAILSRKKQNNKDSTTSSGRKEGGRRGLVAYDDEIKDLKVRVEKLEEMVNRNKKEKVVYEAALKKLNETRKALVDAEAAQTSASNAVVNKEREKRWLKF